MKGVDLSILTDTLRPVPDKQAADPALTIKGLSRKKIVRHLHDTVEQFLDRAHDVDVHDLHEFDFEEVCKLQLSAKYMLSGSFGKLFERFAKYRIFWKIQNSMWRCGFHSANWNETAAIYESLKQFTLGLGPDFEVRLDYTTGCNAKGYTQYSRTFLDGVFAYLIYYKGTHVMTIGFSFASGDVLLLQQIQLVKPKGNRWLYKLPSGHLEFVLERMKMTFSTFSVYLINGDSLVDSIIEDYQLSYRECGSWMAQYNRFAKETNNETERKKYLCDAERHRQNRDTLLEKIKALQEDRERLITNYSETGRFTLRPIKDKFGDRFQLVA